MRFELLENTFSHIELKASGSELCTIKTSQSNTPEHYNEFLVNPILLKAPLFGILFELFAILKTVNVFPEVYSQQNSHYLSELSKSSPRASSSSSL